MTKPRNFIMNSDYATIKNDAKATLTITLPSSTSVAATSVATWTDTITVGTAGSSIRARLVSTSDNVVYATSTVDYYRTSGATVSGSPAGFDVYAVVHRISPTQIRLTALLPNPYPFTMSVTAGLSQTITATVATFLPPKP